MPGDEPETPLAPRADRDEPGERLARRDDRDDDATAAARFGRLLGALRRLDSHPAALRATEAIRRRLPGDDRYGDPLSLAGDEAPQLIAQRLSAVTATRPSALREVGMSALQVWQSLSEAQGRGYGDRELAILFTDIVDFSRFTLEAGDTRALSLLREVGAAVEPPLEAHGGRIVKRLGDGLMVVFPDAREAVEAALEACENVAAVEIDGHRPELRTGIHLGRPRKLGGDFYGADVNIAARVASAAKPGEVLVSATVADRLPEDELELKRRRRFRAKGAPKDLQVYSARRPG